MKPIQKTLLNALAAAALLTTTAASYAQAVEVAPTRVESTQQRTHQRAEKIELSQAQRDQIFNIRHEQAPAQRELKQAVSDAKTALREASNADNFDEAKAKAASDKLGKATADLALSKARTQAQVHAVFTPEQRQQLAERKAARGEQRGGSERKGKGPHGHRHTH